MDMLDPNADLPPDLRQRGYRRNGSLWGFDAVRWRRGHNPALDARAVDLWARRGLLVVTVVLTDSTTLVASLDDFIKRAGTFREKGREVRVYPREDWMVLPRFAEDVWSATR